MRPWYWFRIIDYVPCSIWSFHLRILLHDVGDFSYSKSCHPIIFLQSHHFPLFLYSLSSSAYEFIKIHDYDLPSSAMTTLDYSIPRNRMFHQLQWTSPISSMNIGMIMASWWWTAVVDSYSLTLSSPTNSMFFHVGDRFDSMFFTYRCGGWDQMFDDAKGRNDLLILDFCFIVHFLSNQVKKMVPSFFWSITY